MASSTPHSPGIHTPGVFLLISSPNPPLPQPISSPITASSSPSPTPPSAPPRTLLLMGGSFDPVHRAHTAMAAQARAARCPDATIAFIPAARSPLKSAGPIATDAQRLSMLAAATVEIPNTAILTLELDRARSPSPPNPSYTIDTLTTLSASHPTSRLFLLIGLDQALSLHRWKDPQGILRLAHPIIVPRPTAPVPQPTPPRPTPPQTEFEQHLKTPTQQAFWTPQERDTLLNALLDLPLLPYSSTAVRSAAAAGAWDTVTEACGPSVTALIRSFGLYQTGSEP